MSANPNMTAPDTSRVDVASWQEALEAAARVVENMPIQIYRGKWIGPAGRSCKPATFDDAAASIRALTPPERAASPSGESGWRLTKDGKPRRDAEQSEQWLLTWCEKTATYGLGCIDGDWRHGEEIHLRDYEAWMWLPASPLAAPPAPHVPAQAETGEVERLRATNRDLHRRVQKAEGFRERSGQTIKQLWSWRTEDRKQRRRAEAAEARIRDLAAVIARWQERVAGWRALHRLARERLDNERRRADEYEAQLREANIRIASLEAQLAEARSALARSEGGRRDG